MKMEQRARGWLWLAILVALCLTPQLFAEGERYWEKFPSPADDWQRGGLSGFALDENNGLWIMTRHGCFYWNAEKQVWNKVPFSSGTYLKGAFGTPETGLYATLLGQKDHVGIISRLNQGKVQQVTEFHYDEAGQNTSFRVSLDGRLLNWGGGKLRIYAGGEWIERPADLPQAPLFFDRGDTISLYGNGQLYVIDHENNVSKVDVDKQVNRKATKGALWGNDTAIVLEYGEPGIFAFDVRSGKSVDVSAFNQVFSSGKPVNGPAGKGNAWDLFRAPDGAVWIMIDDPKLTSYILYRLAPDGKLKPMTATAAIPWSSHEFTLNPRCFAVDKSGALWFANRDIGVSVLKDEALTLFKHREDNSPASAGEIVARTDGVIFAAGDNGLYVYNNGVSLTGQARSEPQPFVKLGQPVWESRPGPAWRIDDLILVAGKEWNGIQAIELKNGKIRFTIPVRVREGHYERCWVTRGWSAGQLLVCTEDQMLTVDSATGKILQSVACKRDRRVGPVVVGDKDLVFSPAYHEASFSGLNAAGKVVRNHELPGRIISPLSVCGSWLFVQTRNGGDREATIGINLKTGQSWNEKNTPYAYGCGLVAAADSRYLVEAITSGSLIGRDLDTGRKLWSCPCAAWLPILESVTDRVFTVEANGMAVCVNGDNGKILWQTQLPQQPLWTWYVGRDSYYPCATLESGFLAVTDRCSSLYLLDMATGKILERIALTEDRIVYGKTIGRTMVAAGPWIDGDCLVFADRYGVRAYAHDFSAYRPKGKIPTLAWQKEPAKRSENGNITFSIQAAGADKELTLKYRCDNGRWRKETFPAGTHRFTTPLLANGNHRCRILVYDRYGRASAELVHSFEVACDYETPITDLVIRLGGEMPEDKDKAEKQLVDMGSVVVPYLRKHLVQDDPEISFRINRILKAMEQDL